MDTVEHARAPRDEPDFARRAAYAWIRAADAGVIDAGELSWLLEHLPQTAVAAQTFVIGSVR